jgi:hypothetical protein
MARSVHLFAVIGRLRLPNVCDCSAGRDNDLLLCWNSADGGGVRRTLSRRVGAEFGVFCFDGDSMVTNFTSPDCDERGVSFSSSGMF